MSRDSQSRRSRYIRAAIDSCSSSGSIRVLIPNFAAALATSAISVVVPRSSIVTSSSERMRMTAREAGRAMAKQHDTPRARAARHKRSKISRAISNSGCSGVTRCIG